jgi:serine phosphatase RsbU (regulator of sigma subunit)
LLFVVFSGSVIKAQVTIATVTRLNTAADSMIHIDANAAKKTADQALEYSLQLKNDSLEYESRFNRGVANYFLGNLNAALEDFIKNKSIAQKLKDPVREMEIMNAIGNVYKDNDRYEMALQSYNEALTVSKIALKTDKLITIEYNIATVLNLKHQNDSSNAVCYRMLRALQKAKKTDDPFTGGVYAVILSNYIDKKLKDSVDKYAPVTLKFYKDRGDNLNYSGNSYNLGYFYLNYGDLEKAEEFLTIAKLSKPENMELEIDITKALGTTFFRQKNYKLSAEMYNDCLYLKDSLYTMQTVEKLSEMEVKYETGKKEEQLKRLSAEKEINDLKVKQSKIWLVVSLLGILFVIVVALVLYRQNTNRKKANVLLQHQNAEIIHQKKEITDSINYAKRIQLAILPPDKMVKQLLPNAFVLYKPKDVVSGDFYWMEEKNGIVMFAAVDCTGHGVPGAMMSVVGLNLLNQAVKEKGLTVPADILQHLDAGVTETLRQSADKDSIKDGMDLSLCSYDAKNRLLQYAGAFNNLWIVRKNIASTHSLRSSQELFFEEHLLEIKADKFPIGSNLDGVADNYTNHTFQLQKGDCVYLYSDGYADQFGGPKGKKFKYNTLKKLLISIHDLSPEEQKQKLLQSFESWRGQLEQVDDVLVMGVCV